MKQEASTTPLGIGDQVELQDGRTGTILWPGLVYPGRGPWANVHVDGTPDGHSETVHSLKMQKKGGN